MKESKKRNLKYYLYIYSTKSVSPEIADTHFTMNNNKEHFVYIDNKPTRVFTNKEKKMGPFYYQGQRITNSDHLETYNNANGLHTMTIDGNTVEVQPSCQSFKTAFFSLSSTPTQTPPARNDNPHAGYFSAFTTSNQRPAENVNNQKNSLTAVSYNSNYKCSLSFLLNPLIVAESDNSNYKCNLNFLINPPMVAEEESNLSAKECDINNKGLYQSQF